MAEPIKRRGERPVASAPSKPPPKGTDQKHPAGIFADMATDGPLIGTLVAVVDKAKNLPNLKSIGKQDPYCVIRLGKHVKRTEPDKRGGQTPKWDAELRFPVHDSADYRQLKIVIFTDDKKTELIGECIVNLDNILDTSGGGQSDGWHQCKCRGRYAGDIRVELTFWDERPRETAPLQVNTRQVTAFEKEDYLKRPEKPLAGPRRPGVPARNRELPERPNPKPSKEELVPSSSEEEEPPEPPAAQHRKDRDRRDREPRERQREDRRHRENKREKSRHHRERDGERDGERERERERRREKSRPPPDMYDHDPYRQHQPQHHPPSQPQHGMSYEQDQYGGYNQPSQVATLQDFQSEHIGKLQAQYVEQTQLVPHQRHSPNPAAYAGYQNDIYDQHPGHNVNAMVLANQNGPPVIPQHRHVEFADTRRAVVPASSQPPPPLPQGLHHRKSRSEFYPKSGSDTYQTGGSYNNQLASVSNFAPTPPRHHGYDQPLQQPHQQTLQQYQEQPSYANQGFDQPPVSSIPQPKPPLQQQLQQLPQQPLQYQSHTYQQTYQDPYAEQLYQSQLVRASEYAPPPLPQHGQAAAYRTTPTPQDDYASSSSLALAHSNAAPPPPLPSHRVPQPRMSMPASIPTSNPPAPISQPLPPLQQSIPPQQPIDSYEQNFQLQSLRGYAPPPPLPTHAGSQFKPAPSPQPMHLQQPAQQSIQHSIQDPSMQSRIRGNSEPPPYAAITDGGGLNQAPGSQQNYDQNGYNTHQSYSSGYKAPSGPAAYTSYTDYNKRVNMPQNPEHAFDPTTALVLAGAGGGPPPLPSHSGAQPAHRGRPNVAPISTNAPPRKGLSRSPSPHPLALTPGYGPDSPVDELHQLTFTQLPESLSQYRAADNSIGSSQPLMQQGSQQIDASNRRRSVSPIPPPPSMNNYSQEIVSSRGGPPPLPSASHRMSQNLVYKHDPSENPSENRSNRSSAYDYAHMQSQNNINGILGAQTSKGDGKSSNSSSNPTPVCLSSPSAAAGARDSKSRQPYIEDEIDETDRCADSNYQSASTSYVDEPQSREYMTSSASPHPSSHEYTKRPPSRNPSPYPNYGAEGNRAVSPMPPARRNSDLPPRRTPEPERQPSTRPEHRRMTLGGMPFSPDDYDVINPVGLGSSPGNRSPSGNVSTMPLARSPGAVAMSPGQYMTAKEEKKLREEEKKAAKKARKKVVAPNSANRELEADDILAPDTFAPEPLRRNSFNAGNNGGNGGAATPGPEGGDDRGRGDTQPLSFRPRRQSVSPAPPPSDIYGSSPGRGFMRSNGASTPSSGYGYAATPPLPHGGGGGHRPLPGAPVMRNAIMGPEDYYQQQQQGYGGGGAAPPMRAPQQPNPGSMTQEQWSLSQELSSISIGTSSRRPRTGTWA
ncbi:hypothetical protein EYR41_011636 [Orbilia oligospora]|uniref:C2 domain-containing protein n=1 Tax=Orbilia oligospora TaxID=2813651 RepID=A0A8H2DSC1_ORBOL|nr:hypothetical protein EYR41_011636 [Orbilia oligospora]